MSFHLVASQYNLTSLTFCHSSFQLRRNHLKVIFQLQGSVWPDVIPFCLFNTFVTIVIYILRERDVIDLHFDGGKGMQYLSVLVSFFVVSSIGTTYNRYWEARGFVGKALLAASFWPIEQRSTRQIASRQKLKFGETPCAKDCPIL